MTQYDKDSCWLTTHIIHGMNKICHLSFEDIGEIVQKTPLIEYLLNNYPSLHQEGMGANLHAVQKFLNHYGIHIDIDYSLIGKKGIPS